MVLERQGYVVYRLTDVLNHSAIEVVPSRGNTIIALEIEINGKMTNVLYAPDITKSGGIPVMWPFANRIRQVYFCWSTD
jgi:galactose mutarotase-like enzyme